MSSDRSYNDDRRCGGGGRGRGRGGGWRGRGNYRNQGGGRDRPRGSQHQHPTQPQQSNQTAVPPAASGYLPPQTQPLQQPQKVSVGPASERGDPETASSSTPPVQHAPPQTPPKPSADKLHKPLTSPSVTKEGQIQPIKRPDGGGTHSTRPIELLVNHFRIDFDNKSTIYHYNVDVSHPEGGGIVNRKSDNRFIMYEMPFQKAEFLDNWRLNFAYDDEKSIFSAVKLPEDEYEMETNYKGGEVRRGSYTVKIKFVKELKVSELNAYLRGELSNIPREILQGMDLVMKENPKSKRMVVGRSFYSRNWNDLSDGFAVYHGFQQSLKPTLQGYALCLDYSALFFPKTLPVLDFLMENVRRVRGRDVEIFRGPNDVKYFRVEIVKALEGVKVKVKHRTTNRKYTIAGLSEKDACDTFFDIEDQEGKGPPKKTNLVEYFKNKWNKDIMHADIPCLELGTTQRSNIVPMEFCVLVEGQRYPKERLEPETAKTLKTSTLVKPSDRRQKILAMVKAEDGPCGDIARIFGITLDSSMTNVDGRVIRAPQLKVRDAPTVKVYEDKCHWNLVKKSFVDGKSVDRWALINFTQASAQSRKLQEGKFVKNLRDRCQGLGIRMAEPLVSHQTGMTEFSSESSLEELLRGVVEKSRKKKREKLQLIVCVMAARDTGYRTLKWVSETKIGVVTQCCLSFSANKGQDQYFSNLCLKINAKLGGNNFELKEPLVNFDEHVMFIGADVNHPPPPPKKSCPSIAAVVGTVNWPSLNRYAARVSSQGSRNEMIGKFGVMCLDLVETYTRVNGVRPRRIVVFRDGVSEGQFEKVLGEELRDLKECVYARDYQPPITVIVAQKRHQTRIFHENDKDNVPPGTVVDTGIVHPHDFDFYLCSHYGGIGTSKATHYYVLWDENNFTSDKLQKLIYEMCYTYVRCTKPVSLVPPVYYADLVAYRGRLFHDAAVKASADNKKMKNKSGEEDLGDDFCYLHTDLKDTMFFV